MSMYTIFPVSTAAPFFPFGCGKSGESEDKKKGATDPQDTTIIISGVELAATLESLVGKSICDENLEVNEKLASNLREELAERMLFARREQYKPGTIISQAYKNLNPYEKEYAKKRLADLLASKFKGKVLESLKKQIKSSSHWAHCKTSEEGWPWAWRLSFPEEIGKIKLQQVINILDEAINFQVKLKAEPIQTDLGKTVKDVSITISPYQYCPIASRPDKDVSGGVLPELQRPDKCKDKDKITLHFPDPAEGWKYSIGFVGFNTNTPTEGVKAPATTEKMTDGTLEFTCNIKIENYALMEGAGENKRNPVIRCSENRDFSSFVLNWTSDCKPPDEECKPFLTIGGKEPLPIDWEKRCVDSGGKWKKEKCECPEGKKLATRGKIKGKCYTPKKKPPKLEFGGSGSEL